MKRAHLIAIAACLLVLPLGCRVSVSDREVLANELENSLFEYILEVWYPRNIDSMHGGYLSDFTYDWQLDSGPQVKAIVQQARHVWATSMVLESYPERKEFLEYAAHGFRFLRDYMWDKEYGGFHAYVEPGGDPVEESMDDKRVYGQAFAVYGLSRYYRVSRDEEALSLAKKAFLWMEEHAHDPEYGGYFEFLARNGTPVYADISGEPRPGSPAGVGLKDYNSSIHLMEAFTELYSVWPDPLVRRRMEEMFLLIRDTFVHPDGYLQLYFSPDWRLVTGGNPGGPSGRNSWEMEHYTYGHDVETAFLLLETAHILEMGQDATTGTIAKRLVDHSLESGWDGERGGFYDAGIQQGDSIVIINDHKSWWGLVEGMHALLLMSELYPDDPNDYYGKFLKAWEHIDGYLIDKTHGGWYNASLDTYPENAKQRKSHIWKTTYHNARGMVNCIRMLAP